MSVIPGFYTVQEAADKIGVSHSQVTRYIKRKLLQARDLGHQLIIDRNQVDSFKRPLRGNPAFRTQKRRNK